MLVDVQTLQLEADFPHLEAAFFQVATVAGLSFWQHFEAASVQHCEADFDAAFACKYLEASRHYSEAGQLLEAVFVDHLEADFLRHFYRRLEADFVQQLEADNFSLTLISCCNWIWWQ